MITIQEIFDTLAHGEFSNTKIGQSPLESIVEKDWPKVVSAINLGLLDIHKKVQLRKGEYTVHQHASVTDYILRRAYSEVASGMGEDYWIELDEDTPWPDDFIKINSLWETDGTKIPLNDNTYKYSPTTVNTTTGGFTPSFDILRMTPRSTPITVIVEYRARYPKIVITDSFDPEQYQLDIPDFIVEPLLFFIASRVFRGMASKAAEGETTSAVTYHTLYRTAILELQHQGMVTTDEDSSAQFENNGWV